MENTTIKRYSFTKNPRQWVKGLILVSFLSATVLSRSSVLAAEANVLGFWDFKDGAAGSSVGSVSSRLGATTYTGTAGKTSATGGVLPLFDASSPGYVYSDAQKDVLVSAKPQSVKFMYDPAVVSQQPSSTPAGGLIDFPGVMAQLAGKSEFTVEFFLKFDKDFEYYTTKGAYVYNSKTSCFLGDDDNGVKIVTPNGVASKKVTGIAAQGVKGGNVSVTGSNYNDDTWRHMAVVFQSTQSGGTTGTISFYVGYVLVGSFDYDNGTYAKSLTFRLGTGRDSKKGTEPFQGYVSALRISTVARSIDGFLHAESAPDISKMETAGYWDFKNGTVGADIDSTPNQVDSAIFEGVGSATTEHKPQYSDDRPARYVFSDSSFTTLLTENPQSARFYEGSSSGNGGKLSLTDLASSLSRLDEYTVEFFFKVHVSPFSRYRTLAGWCCADEYGLKLNLDGSTSYNTCTCEPLRLSGQTVSGSGVKGTVSLELGNAWHHFAAVYRKSEGGIWTYIDQVKSNNRAAITNRMSTASWPLVLGTSAFSVKEKPEVFGGYISCVRVTPRALDVSKFMVACKEKVRPNTVFALSFNEGTAEGKLPNETDKTGTACTSYPDEIITSIEYNLFAANNPTYMVDSRAGREVLWGDVPVWTNKLCMQFPGVSAIPSGTSNRGYYGAALRFPRQTQYKFNPKSWTMEGFFKLEATGLAGASVKSGLLFGKAGNTDPFSKEKIWWPRSSWLLTYNKDGALTLEWTERPSADYQSYGEDTPDVYRQVTTANSYLNDRRWHHVALSYDSDCRQFKLYVDYELVLTQPLIGTPATQNTVSLYDGAFSYYFCRFVTTGGYEGFMDEIRFSSEVLAPKDFEHYVKQGLIMVVR